MKVVSLSLDPKILDPESVPSTRVSRYGDIVEYYSIIIPTPSTVTIQLSDSVTVYGISGANKVIQLWKMYRKVVELVHRGKCDVITSQDTYFLGLLGLFVARRYHLGLEVQVLGIEKLTSFRKRIAVYVLKHASVVRALSYRIKERVETEFGITHGRMHVVPIYVDVTKLGLQTRTLDEHARVEFEKAVQTFDTQYGTKVNFLAVSRLVPIKRIDLMLSALQEVVVQNTNVLLHIVGDGPEKKSLHEIVRKLCLEKYVIFHGYQSGHALGVLYAQCDCFLLTSAYEGWGMVVIEAATSGLPIIMTEVGCAGEFIVHDESGLIIPVNDSDALAKAMLRILHDTDLRTKLSRGVIQRLSSLPSFDAVLTQYKNNWERAQQYLL